MRAKFLLVGGLFLLVAACTAKVNHPPQTFDKQLLIGKWKNVSDALFVLNYEFAEDGGMKMGVKGLEKPVPGHYSWSGERNLNLEYKLSGDDRKAYQAAVKAYKKDVTDGVQNKKIPDKAEGGMLSAARDELPEKETVRASISEKPRLLILVDESSGATTTLEQVE